MASGAYAKGIEQHLAGSLDWDADTIKVMAAKTGATLNKDGHNFLSDVNANRYVGTTDQTAGSKTNTIDTSNDRVELNFGQVTFAAVALDGSNNVIAFITYKDTGSAATSPLIAFDDTADIIPNGTDINYTPNPEGLVQYSYGA